LKNAIGGVVLLPFRLCVPRKQASLRRTVCTPRSSRFVRLASHRFYEPVRNGAYQRAAMGRDRGMGGAPIKAGQ